LLTTPGPTFSQLQTPKANPEARNVPKLQHFQGHVTENVTLSVTLCSFRPAASPCPKFSSSSSSSRNSGSPRSLNPSLTQPAIARNQTTTPATHTRRDPQGSGKKKKKKKLREIPPASNHLATKTLNSDTARIDSPESPLQEMIGCVCALGAATEADDPPVPPPLRLLLLVRLARQCWEFRMSPSLVVL
jgi:hypothetical protein